MVMRLFLGSRLARTHRFEPHTTGPGQQYHAFMPTPVLDVVDVHKSYGTLTALRGVSLAVNEGEILGLLGPNGAGKTTLISILTGLLEPDAGEVRLLGKPFRRRDREPRRYVGLGTQDLSIYPGLTARENLHFFGKLYGLRGVDLRSRAAELLAAVGLSDRAEDRAGTFSGGMKRRLNLAAAVMHRPRILFLDEPTTGVDPQSRNHIFEQVRSLNRAGMTIIYTSHYMEEVQTLCQRIAILDGGKIDACDTLPNLLATMDATIRLGVSGDLPRVREKLEVLPAVKSVRMDGETIELTVREAAPILAVIARTCQECGVEATSISITEPTLERVFLNLTGQALRD